MSRPELELACKHCRHLWPRNITMGVVAAHFDTEHDASKVHLDLVMVCDRCRKEMPRVRSETSRRGVQRHHYACTAPCYRTATVTQDKAAGP